MRLGKVPIVAGACLLAVPAIVAVRAHADAPAAQWHGGHSGWRHSYMGFLAGIQLTDAQRAQMHLIVSTAWSSNKTQIERFRAVRKQIGDALASTDTVAPDTMDALQQQQAEIGEQLDAERLAVAIQVRGLLTPEQLAQSASIHAKLSSLHEQERELLRQDIAPGAR